MTTSVSLPSTVVSTPSIITSGPPVARPLEDIIGDTISVLAFGAVGDGTTDDKVKIQNAIDYAESVAGGFGDNKGVSIYFPGGREYVVKSTLEINQSRVALFSDPGNPALITFKPSGVDKVLFKLGNDGPGLTFFLGIYDLNLQAHPEIANMSDTTCIKCFDVLRSNFQNLWITSFGRGIEGYRLMGNHFHNIRFEQRERAANHTRAQFAVGLFSRQTDGLTSGTNKFSQIEVLESNLTRNPVWDVGFLIKSADTFYLSDSHIYKCDVDFKIDPAGTAAGGNTITDIFVSNTYFDEPGSHSVLITGKTASVSASLPGYYQDITFSNCLFRGGAVIEGDVPAYADNIFKVSVSEASGNGVRDIRVDGCHFRQAGATAMVVEGPAAEKYAVDSIMVSGCNFRQSAMDGSTTYGDFDIDAKCVAWNDNVHEAPGYTVAHIGQIRHSGSGNRLVAAVGNNLVNVAANDAKPLTNADRPFDIEAGKGDTVTVYNTTVKGQGGKTACKVTADNTPCVVWSRPVPSGKTGLVVVRAIGRGIVSGVSAAYEVSAHYRRFNDGVTDNVSIVNTSFDPKTTRETESPSAAPSSITIQPNITDQTIEVQVTGINGTNTYWDLWIEAY